MSNNDHSNPLLGNFADNSQTSPMNSGSNADVGSSNKHKPLDSKAVLKSYVAADHEELTRMKRPVAATLLFKHQVHFSRASSLEALAGLTSNPFLLSFSNAVLCLNRNYNAGKPSLFFYACVWISCLLGCLQFTLKYPIWTSPSLALSR